MKIQNGSKMAMDSKARKRTVEQAKTHKQLQRQEMRKNIIYSVQTQLLFIKYNQLHVLVNIQQSSG
jgi:hypothetical protein